MPANSDMAAGRLPRFRGSMTVSASSSIGTLNKALFPGLRIGYAVIPHALLRSFVAARYLMDRQPSTLSQAVVAAFMEEGHFAAHIRRMRALYRGAARRAGCRTQALSSAPISRSMRRTRACISWPSRGAASRTPPSSSAGRQHGVVVRPHEPGYILPARRAISPLCLASAATHARRSLPRLSRLARAVEAQSKPSPRAKGSDWRRRSADVAYRR